MDGCDDYHALIAHLYDMPFGLLHAWATPDNRACLEMLVEWCDLDRELLDKLGMVFAVLEVEP
jgi:hypothetical protein